MSVVEKGSQVGLAEQQDAMAADVFEASGTRTTRLSATAAAAKSRWLAVRVSDLSTDRIKTHVSFPLELIETGLRIGARFIPEIAGVDLNSLLVAARRSAGGRILAVADHDKSERVEISVDWSENKPM
jgi:hypothetical protein